jgi:phage terminase small subunit
MKLSEFKKLIHKEVRKTINEQALNEGTGISEQMWVKELTGKTIKKGFVKTNGPDLMLQMTDGTTYTFKQLTALIKWDEKGEVKNAMFYKNFADKMLDLVEEIVDDYLEDFDSEEDREAAKSVNSEDSLIKFYKQVLKNLKTGEVNAITINDIKKEVKKLFTTNNVKVP